MRKITRIEPTVPSIKQRKRVAAYARVSMQSERMLHSLSAQISYYSSLIQKNPDWEYVGVYADDFISGTNKVRREEFQRMLADCEKGKIDIILTKSISRFARNTVDLLETVRHLKSLGIEVRFEKENINSMSGDGELMLSILASFAQEESRSISDNVKWGIRKRMQNGMITASGHFTVYGYRWEGDELVIVPEEAKIVKRIFQNYLDGKSRLETEREFAAEGITSRQGCRWVDSNIRKVLENITYTGNMLEDFLNNGFMKVNINMATGEGLLPGDVLLNVAKHTALYIGDGKIVNATGSENGGKYGKDGDQTGQELRIQGYYNKPWDYVLRYEEDAQEDPIHEGPVYYSVKRGDTLTKIAKRFGTTVQQLVVWNKLKNPDLIIVGQNLIIPTGSDSQIWTGKIATQTDPLNIRRTPNGKVIGSLPKGSTVRISGTVDGWLKLADRDGYVSTKYVQRV